MLFFLIFSPHVNVVGFTFKTVYIFVVVPALLGFFKFNFNKQMPNIIKMVLLFIFFSLVYHILMFFIHGVYDKTWILNILMGILEVYASIYVADIYIRKYNRNAFNELVSHLFVIGVAHSIVMVVLYISPSFKNLFYSFVQLTELAHSSSFRDDAFSRFSGFVNSGFGSLSVINSVLFLMGLFSYFFTKKISLFSFVVGSGLLFVASILSGRLGIVVMFLLLLLLFVFPINIRDVRRKKFALFFVLIPLIFSIIFYLSFNDVEKFYFVFETYFNYIEYGELDKSSELILSEKLSTKLSFIHVLFGTGEYTNDYADSGYLTMIHGTGIVGSLISYSFLYVIFKVKRLLPMVSLGHQYLLYLLVLTLLFINFKNLYFFGYNDIFQVLFLLMCTLALLDFRIHRNLV